MATPTHTSAPHHVGRGVLVAALLGLTTLSGCEVVDSEDIATSGIFANHEAVSDGTKTVATSIYRVGGETSNTFLELSSGDSATCTSASGTKTQNEWKLGDIRGYRADFDEVAEGESFTFTLTRDAHESAPTSEATLPAVFSISVPAEGAVINRADGVTVSWTPSGSSDDMRVQLRGDCIWDVFRDVSGDPGTHVIESKDINYIGDAQGCDVDVVVRRLRAGSVDPAFGEGGKTWGIQERRVEIRLDK